MTADERTRPRAGMRGCRPARGPGPLHAALPRRRLLQAALAALAGSALPHALAGEQAAKTPSGRRGNAPQAERAPAASQPRPFSFALIGDVPYHALEAMMLERVFGAFDEDLAFAIHVGDLKAGWERCDDALLESRRGLLDASPVPLVFVPGDNEWTDCGRPRAGRFDPLERLEHLRRIFFGAPRPIGAGPRHGARPLALRSQAGVEPGGPPENLRWLHEGVLFVTLNLPGSNAGLGANGLELEDWRRRSAFNERWLREAYESAARDGAFAVVVAGHANPRFDRGPGRPLPRATRRSDGYAPLRALLHELSREFRGATLFLHGDTHHHSVERISPKLLRVESYGSPFSDNWVRIDVDPGAAEPFTITSRRSERETPMP